MKAPAGLSSAVGALAATLLATTVAAALLDILGLVVPGSAEGYVIPLCFGAALVGGIITRAARAHDALSGAWLRQRLPEILGLALVARLAGWLWHLATNPAAEAGLDAFASWGEAWRWVGGGHVGVAVLCALAAWYSAGMLASALQTLEPNAETLALEHESGVNTDRSATRDRLVDTLLALGVVVTGLTTLARLASGGAINNVWRIVLYFALTFVLLAQSRFALLRAQWARAGMSVRPGLAGRWAAIALVLLVALGIGVLPLSTRYARDLLLAANWVLNLVVFVIGLVGWLFVAALSALVSAIAALLLPGGGRGTPPVGPPPVFPAAEAARTANMPLDLRPIAFVVLIGGSLLFVLHRLWTARKEIMRFAGRSRAGLRLLTALRAVRRALRGGDTR
ncbi:MAG: hypothetical protein K1X39_10085, partial [Thermoflexales bacterium]|nr:hypothetical protein [Thermoflexales bacterium]